MDGTHDRSSADVSARVAWADDAPAIAAVQVRAWRSSYADLLPAEVLDDPRPRRHRRRHGARPSADRADARNRVLVALERNLVTGFVVTGPAGDPDCDPVATASSPTSPSTRTSAGPGTAPGCSRPGPTPWSPTGSPGRSPGCPAADDGLRAFLTEAGWGPDGAHRTLDLLGDGTTTVKQVRLHTALVD